MTAVFLQEFPVQDAEPGQKPGKERQLEDHPHHEYHSQEIVHIGIKGNLVDNGLADLILCKESERERENQRVPYGASDEKHERAEEESATHGLLFRAVECGTDEFPYFIDNIREEKHQGNPERGGNMGHELRCDIDIDDVSMEAVIGEVREERHGLPHRGKPPVYEEIRGRGTKDEIVEDMRHGQE